MSFRTRLSIIDAYRSKSRDFAISPMDVLVQFLRPPIGWLVRSHISKIEHHGDYLEIHIRGAPRPLMWPHSLPIQDAVAVIVDTFDQASWHFYEIHETKVQPGDVVIDCGAAEGCFALRACNVAARVVAFEPQAIFVASLNETFGSNSRVEVVHAALGARAGGGVVVGNSISATVSADIGAHGTPVAIDTIDAWCQGQVVNYIKADVEGAELDVLRGGAESLAAYRPKIAVTTYHPRNNWREIVEFLRSVVPDYRFRLKGVSYLSGTTKPMVLHAWVPT